MEPKGVSKRIDTRQGHITATVQVNLDVVMAFKPDYHNPLRPAAFFDSGTLNIGKKNKTATTTSNITVLEASTEYKGGSGPAEGSNTNSSATVAVASASGPPAEAVL